MFFISSFSSRHLHFNKELRPRLAWLVVDKKYKKILHISPLTKHALSITHVTTYLLLCNPSFHQPNQLPTRRWLCADRHFLSDIQILTKNKRGENIHEPSLLLDEMIRLSTSSTLSFPLILNILPYMISRYIQIRLSSIEWDDFTFKFNPFNPTPFVRRT